MINKPILINAKKIHIYLDSNTFENLFSNSDRLAIALLRYYNSNCLEFVRSPLESVHIELANIIEYQLIIDDNLEIKNVVIDCDEHKRSIGFNYAKDDIKRIAQHIYKKTVISEEELKTITTVFIQAIFNYQEALTSYKEFEEPNIYITNDDILLKNRLWFEAHFPGLPLNIMSVEEASIFIDIFFKKNKKYCASCRYSLNKGLWYWLSMRLKIPHYNVGDPIIDALAFRLYYALMSIDEISIQFYSGVNNDTMDNTLYHFNYLISLITGMFDNLALKTDTYLGINFSNPTRISLSNKSGKDFLREIRNKNQNIRDHIHSFVDYIQLIYLFRELVIHREGLVKVGFNYRDEQVEWKANFIKISEEIRNKIKCCGDKTSKYIPISEWGIYKINNEFYLEPHNFSIHIISKLNEFIDKYLELLGYPSFVDDQKTQNSDFAKKMLFFEKYHLGFN